MKSFISIFCLLTLTFPLFSASPQIKVKPSDMVVLKNGLEFEGRVYKIKNCEVYFQYSGKLYRFQAEEVESLYFTEKLAQKWRKNSAFQGSNPCLQISQENKPLDTTNRNLPGKIEDYVDRKSRLRKTIGLGAAFTIVGLTFIGTLIDLSSL